jgi:4a-hydroxytetrahydrobiopterin dehydratase
MSREKLSISEVDIRRQALDGWALAADGQAITRTFKFAGFAQAFGFMAECAIHAEKIDHHPEWSNVYRTVDVLLTTHSAKGLTALDFDLAAFMDRAARHH